MSQPPYPPYSPEPHSGQPGSGAPQGYPPPGGSQQPGYPPPPDASPYGPPQSQPQYGTQPPPAQYGDPQYGAPQHGAPQYGAPQYGAPPPVRKKSSALKIVLIVVGVIAVLCVGGVAIVAFAAKDKVEQVVNAASIKVVEPATLGGREKITDPSLTASVSSLDSAFSQVPGVTSSVSSVYGDLQKQDVVMVAAASTASGSAQSRFDEFTSGMSTGGLKVDEMTAVDPGPLGGIAKCGDTDSAGVPMAICVWSDDGSIGMFAMMFKEKADLAKEFVAMRGEVEQKS
jgi:hypothetical protein